MLKSSCLSPARKCGQSLRRDFVITQYSLPMLDYYTQYREWYVVCKNEICETQGQPGHLAQFRILIHYSAIIFLLEQETGLLQMMGVFVFGKSDTFPNILCLQQQLEIVWRWILMTATVPAEMAYRQQDTTV